MENKEILIKAINEYAGYSYIGDNDEESRNDIVTTQDTVEGFKDYQEHVKTIELKSGNLEVFNAGNFDLYVMDFGAYRLALKDS